MHEQEPTQNSKYGEKGSISLLQVARDTTQV